MLGEWFWVGGFRAGEKAGKRARISLIRFCKGIRPPKVQGPPQIETLHKIVSGII